MPETFSDDDIRRAIEQFLKLGEESLHVAHKGYFSGNGWAARCLRFHLAQLTALYVRSK